MVQTKTVLAMATANGKGFGLALVMPEMLAHINTRGRRRNNRNVVFCMNQLGGVGRISNMFATTADGVKEPCKNGCRTI